MQLCGIQRTYKACSCVASSTPGGQASSGPLAVAESDSQGQLQGGGASQAVLRLAAALG